jgi:hypothetical protein
VPGNAPHAGRSGPGEPLALLQVRCPQGARNFQKIRIGGPCPSVVATTLTT